MRKNAHTVLGILLILASCTIQSNLFRESGNGLRFALGSILALAMILSLKAAKIKLQVFDLLLFSFVLLQCTLSISTEWYGLGLQQACMTTFFVLAIIALRKLELKEMRFLLFALFLINILNLPISLHQYFVLKEAATGVMFNPNSLAFWALCQSMLLAHYHWKKRIFSRWVVLVNASVSIAVVLLSGSLSYLYLTPFIVIAMLSDVLKLKSFTTAKNKANLTSSVRTMVTIVLCVSGLLGIYSNINHGGIQSRISLWKGSLRLLAEHPLVGIGPGKWFIDFAGLSQHSLLSSYGKIIYLKPHNEVLRLGVETGLVGLLLLMILLLFVFDSLRKNKVQFSYSWYVCLALILLDLSINFTGLQAPLLLLLAFFLGSIPVMSKQIEISKHLLILPGVLVLIFWVPWLDNSRQLQSALSQRSAEKTYSLLKNFNHRFFSHDPPSGASLGYILAKHEPDPYKKIELLEGALRMHPNDCRQSLLLANVYVRTSQKEKAIELYERSIELCPCFTDAYIDYSALVYQSGDLKKAIEILNGVCTDNRISSQNRSLMKSELSAEND